MCKISIIMSCYNENERIFKCAIESILNQTYNNFEFIIILDNPKNEVLKNIVYQYEKSDKRIKFYINEKNLGLCNSLNKGLSLSRGKYICRMDADDVSLPDRIEHQLRYLIDNDYDLIGGITQMIDDDDNIIYSINKIPSDYKKIKRIIKYNQCIAHPTWMGRKSVFDDLNGYRNIPLCEDYDFTLRALLKGYKISNLNETVLQYRMTANSISRTNLYEQFLYLKYITKAYTQGEIVDIEKANKYVIEHNDPKKSKQYLRANVVFNRMLKEMEDKKILLFIKDGFTLLFCSKDYLNKIYRFAMLHINS